MKQLLIALSATSRINIAFLSLIMVIIVLTPYVFLLPQHGDERQYAWKSWYFVNKIINFDFDEGSDIFIDPGFNPGSYWAQAEPFGSHALYATIIHILKLKPPLFPYSYTDSSLQGPNTDVPRKTLIILRISAVIFSALGISMVTSKFGYPGLISIVILLLIPHVRSDLPRVWSEGPLLLGLGLCAVTYRTRWFPLAVGLTASFKLTGLILWPLLFLPKSSGASHRIRAVTAILVSIFVFWMVNPFSWFSTGPFYISKFISYRIEEWSGQSAIEPSGFFLPTRYLWPFELLVLLILMNAILPAWIHKLKLGSK